MAYIKGTQRYESGIALGGLGAGTVELRSDGEFHEWQIANVEKWSRDSRDNPHADNGENLSGALSFYLRTQGENENEPVRVRRLGFGMGLGQHREEYNYRMFSWLKTIEKIEYCGEFPMASLRYVDRDLPIEVTLEAMSPFVPHKPAIAGTPGFYLKFKLENKSSQRVRTSLAGKLRNPVCRIEQTKKVKTNIKNIWDWKNRRVNKIIHSDESTALIMSANSSSKAPDNGSCCLSVQGGNISWISGDYAAFMNEYVATGELGISEESFLFAFRRKGQLPNTINSHEMNAKISNENDDLAKLKEVEIDNLLCKLKESAYAQSILERIIIVSPDILDNLEGKLSVLTYLRDIRNDLRSRLSNLHGTWGDGALCSEIMLEPGESTEITFVMSWYFPNLYSAANRYVGHIYENIYKDSFEVNAYLVSKAKSITEAVKAFAKNLYSTSFDSVYADAWSSQLAVLLKCSWWARNGDFGIWEGLGSCGLHTTDITYHGSFGLLALFPELQKKQMKLGAKFQRDDGRVHHYFTPDFSEVDDGFDRVDMNQQFVLLACRDFMSTGDESYLSELWPNIVHAMKCTELLDTDGDGLPDHDTRRNTYDAWNFSGTPTYISGLWLASLKAAIYMADYLSEDALSAHWTDLFNKGIVAFEKKLWNGKYYNLWVDGDRHDDCCMTNQLDGEWYTRIIGLGGFISDDRVRQVLQTIFANNYSSENGLVNATYHENATPTLYTYRNCQAEANWTGIEYLIASYCDLLGLHENSLDIVKNVHERYMRLGEFWNHSECGDHYYRALSSWALMTSLTGFIHNASEKTLTVKCLNVDETFNAPWVTCTGWGNIKFDNGVYNISVLSGTLDVERIILPKNNNAIRVNIMHSNEVEEQS